MAGLALADYVREIQAIVASGAPIRAINVARIARSQLKGGKLARLSAAPVFTAVASDVTDDDLMVIGSGPTCPPRDGDVAVVVSPMKQFAIAMRDEARAHATLVRLRDEPFTEPVAEVAAALLAEVRDAGDAGTVGEPGHERGHEPGHEPGNESGHERGHEGRRLRRAGQVLVAWGESTVALPATPGVGGRAQQLALELARGLRASDRFAFVAGTDGSDGPRLCGRPTPAGAFVDGATWDAIAAAGIDPASALGRCDAGTALAAVGALVVTHPTGVNHGDIVVIGRAPG